MVPWSYVDHLQKENADDLAFYPLQALQRQGTVVVAEENGEACGYLWHGPLNGGRDAVIYQACIDYDLRRRQHGIDLVRGLAQAASAAGCTGIRLRSASSSVANEFWRAIGFVCVAVVPGGKRRMRDLNVWRLDLQPTLGLVLPVPPSRKQASRRLYDAARRQGEQMSSRFARPAEYARLAEQPKERG